MRPEVLTGIERRRRWSDAEKRSKLAEVGVKGARVADVALRHDLTRQHIYQWRGESLTDGRDHDSANRNLRSRGDCDCRDRIGQRL